jgi:hypothetical protein
MSVRKALAVAVLLMTADVSAQVPFTPIPEKNPYRNLFADPSRAREPHPTNHRSAPAPQKPRLVCGMRIILADPSVDPKIRVAPPTAVAHTMRTVTPSTCRPE